jgi:orotate phosphoribosyltransferase
MYTRTIESWINRYRRLGALWMHDQNIRRPHVKLNGYHSNGLFNSELVMENPELLDHAASDIVALLYRKNISLFNTVNRVVGPAYGAITFAHDIARNISHTRKNFPCLYSFVVKKFSDDIKSMVFEKSRVIPGERILLCDNVIASGESVLLSMKAIQEEDGVILPCIVAIINRSGLDEICGKRIIALINYPMPKWLPHECPLCKVGSEAIAPSAGNWARLNAEY